MTSGWQGERHRHSLAKRRISTVFNGVAKGKKNHFATGKSLSAFLQTPEGQEYEEKNFESLFEVPWNGYVHGIPYWIDNYEDEVTGEWHYGGHSHNMDDSFRNVILQHVGSIYEEYKYGDILEFEGKDYYYANSVGSSTEMEHQADNSEMVYSNIGENFFRIWKPIPDTHIQQIEHGQYALIHDKITIKTVPVQPEHLVEYAKKRGWDIKNLEIHVSDDGEYTARPFMNIKLFNSIMK